MKLYKNKIYGCFFVFFLNSSNAHSILNEEIAESKNSWNFIAYLDDMEIGYHNFEVVTRNNQTTVLTQAEFDVSFMFITVFKYEHNNKEIWKNDCLVSLNSNTFNDGEKLFVKLSNKEGLTQIETVNKKQSEANCVRSFAYWDADLIKSNVLLNSQSGELINVTYNFIGAEKLLVNNTNVDAQRYQILGKDELGIDIDINLWYDANNKWLALESKLENGRSIRYQLKQEIN